MRAIFFAICICVLVLPAIAVAQQTAYRVAPDNFAIDPNNHHSLAGVSSDVTTDLDNWCFGITVPDDTWAGGDEAALSLFWADVKESDFQAYGVTWAIRTPAGAAFILLDSLCEYDLTGLDPGTPLNFCCGLFVEIPPGFSVSTIWAGRVCEGGSDCLQGVVGDFNLTP